MREPMNGQPIAGKAEPHLLRRFGLLQATALNMTNMIGIGPFITIPALMSALHGPQAMLGWVVAVLITVPDALVWSELGAAMPGSGGSYVYLRDGFGRETFGRLMAFLFVWQFILSGPLEIASGYIGFAQYLNYLWPGVTTQNGLSLAGAVIVVSLGLLCIALLYRRITSIGKITVSLWIGTMLTTGAVIVTGALHFNPELAFDFPPEGFKFSLGFLLGLGAATRIGVYDYLGYYDVCFIGDEVKDPGKVIPRSILISIVGVALVYVAINLSIVGVVPWREFVPASDPPAPYQEFSARFCGCDRSHFHCVQFPAPADRHRRPAGDAHSGAIHRTGFRLDAPAQTRAGNAAPLSHLALSAAAVDCAGGVVV